MNSLHDIGKEAFRLRRESILLEAARCFNRKSYHGTTMESIAHRLKVTKAALYHYVKSKEQILYECHRAVLDIAMEGMHRAEEQGSAPDEKLKIALSHYIEGVASRLTGSVLLLHKEMLHPKLHHRIVKQRDDYERWLRRVIADGITAGKFAKRDPKLTVFLILGSINWIPLWYSSEGERSPQEIAEAFVEFLIQGLLHGSHEPEFVHPGVSRVSPGS